MPKCITLWGVGDYRKHGQYLCKPSSWVCIQQLALQGHSCSTALVWNAHRASGCLGPATSDDKPSHVWWLLIRYSHRASHPGENISGLVCLTLIILFSLFTVVPLLTEPHTNMTVYNSLNRIQAQLLTWFTAKQTFWLHVNFPGCVTHLHSFFLLCWLHLHPQPNFNVWPYVLNLIN